MNRVFSTEDIDNGGSSLIRSPPRLRVAPLFPRGAMVRSRKFWKSTEKNKDKFLVMLRGITRTSLTSKSLIVLLEYSDASY